MSFNGGLFRRLTGKNWFQSCERRGVACILTFGPLLFDLFRFSGRDFSSLLASFAISGGYAWAGPVCELFFSGALGPLLPRPDSRGLQLRLRPWTGAAIFAEPEASQAAGDAAAFCLNIGLIVAFKYMPWFLQNWAGIRGEEPKEWHWTLPISLSFYAFQSLTYTIDLYRRDIKGTRSLLAHLAAVSFFPTILAGPITRVSSLMDQFEKPKKLDPADGGRALFLIGIGLVKKLMIADYLAVNLVNRVFDFPNLYTGGEVLVACLRLRVPDLLRFFRLHRYRDRFGAAAGDQAAAEFQRALPGRERRRFLAALAHQPFQLAARLLVFFTAGKALQAS